jgi:putative molybdopterin biosynthesis protein
LAKNKSYLHCLHRQQAQELWRQTLLTAGFFTNLPVETVAVVAALGRVSASSIYAKQSVPHYNSAAMDGIAVWAQDTFGAQEVKPKQLTVLSTGQAFTAGCCYMVDTGDVLPLGTSAVIMIEDVHLVNEVAEIVAATAPWQHVRIIGEDIVANELVIPEHHVIIPVDVAALLAAGVEWIEVIKKPKVGVIPTGDEIVATTQELKPGTILDVNSHMLGAAVTQWGGEPNRVSIVKDDRQAIRSAILASLQLNDMVIINAGTSAGREDYTADMLAELGEVVVHGVAIKPGKPVILAICQGKPVIGLPGYPVAAMLTAELFVQDALLGRQKLPVGVSRTMEATLAKQMPSAIGVEEYIRVSVGNVQGKMVVAPLSRGAGLISSLTKAHGIISVEQGSGGLSAGATVSVRLLQDFEPQHTVLAVGSHDLALEVLGVFLRRKLEKVSLSCANVGSMGGIMAIRNKESHIAGIHLLDEETGRYNVDYIQKFLPATTCQLVHLAMRQQGLMVMPGNGKNILGLSDLVRPDITFINRQRGSGTRMLLDYEMNKGGLLTSQIVGYEKEVGTHMAVAASIAAGTVDTGLGVKAAALAVGLDFIPIAEEQYDLLLNFPPEDERLQAILLILQSDEFRREVEALGGYDLRQAGKLLMDGVREI